MPLLAIHLVMQQQFTEHLLRARHCSGPPRYKGMQKQPQTLTSGTLESRWEK